MHAELLQMASELARREEAFVLAVVVRRRPASSAQAGDMAVITASGEFHGWLGGSCTQPTVVREAQRALADGEPRLLALSPDPEAERRPGVAVFPMTCHSGGSVEIYLDPILPAPRLTVFGESPTARALLRLAAAMGYSVSAPFAGGAVVDAAEAGGAGVAGGAGEAGEVGAVAGQGATDGSGPLADLAAEVASNPRCFAVVATMGEGDAEAIRAALQLRPTYLGVVASAKRFAQLRQTLLAQGVPAAALDSIRSPAGVAIGAQTPEEIAISVLAEIVERGHAAAASPAAPAPIAAPADEGAAEQAAGGGVQPAGDSAQAGAGAGQAIDPICGMTVDVAGARHTAEVGGRTWYFCCSGCRERFLAQERVAVLGGAA
jgi:xanthine dehydrogenase accessory factor